MEYILLFYIITVAVCFVALNYGVYKLNKKFEDVSLRFRDIVIINLTRIIPLSLVPFTNIYVAVFELSYTTEEKIEMIKERKERRGE